MLEQELKAIWKNSSDTEIIKLQTSRLQLDLEEKMNKINKDIRKRDVLEMSASVIGIVMFGLLAYEIPFPLTKVACGISMLWFAYLIFKLRANKRKKKPVDLALPLREQLHIQKANLEQEAKLLDTVLYWYVLPPLFANILFVWGFNDPRLYNWFPFIIEKMIAENMLRILPISLTMKSVYLLGALVFNGFVVWINKRAARKTCYPLIKDIEEIQKQLDN